MSFYDEMADVASEVLDEFKQGTVTLKRPGVPTPAVNSWDKPTPAAPTSYTLKATVADAQSDKATRAYVDGETILGSDAVVTCAVPAVEPALTDVVEVNGIAKPIKKVIRIPASGTAVAFKLILEG